MCPSREIKIDLCLGSQADLLNGKTLYNLIEHIKLTKLSQTQNILPFWFNE